jgi:membrane associated rhomboid family serine protease
MFRTYRNWGEFKSKKKSHILLLNYCIVRCFFVILSAIFVYLGHRKQWQNIVYELSKVRCWSAFTNTKFSPQTRTIESVFFFNLTIKTKEVKLNFRVKIDKVIFHESSIIIELEYYRVIKIMFLHRRWLCALFKCATLYGP